ncbi:DUF2326 domain-containing protein [Streptomyces sp. L7]
MSVNNCRSGYIETFANRAAKIDRAAVVFQELSEAIYGDRGGLLVISNTDNGPKFSVSIDGERSKGITNMLTYCFDLTLMRIACAEGRSPSFLVHDSHIFDGVDTRQVRSALEVAVKECRDWGYQHLVTLNSDALPEVEDFSLEPYILPVRLTDQHENGGLFGVRFQ